MISRDTERIVWELYSKIDNYINRRNISPIEVMIEFDKVINEYVRILKTLPMTNDYWLEYYELKFKNIKN